MTKRKEINRREFVTTTTGVAVAAALGPTIRIKRPQKTLKILQWSHFVPSYDVWFDKYAKDWGTAKGVEVTVDHIALADLGTRANAEVAAQQGHDLFQFLSPPGAFEPQVLDMADVVKEAERQNGPLLDLCKRSTYNPVTRKWFGFSDNYVPDPGDYLKSIWTEIGMPDGPATWEDLVTAAPQIKAKHPEIQIPIGIGMSQELDSNMAARAMLWSFDGSIQDANENVVLKSDQALEALTFGARLFQLNTAGVIPTLNSRAPNVSASSAWSDFKTTFSLASWIEPSNDHSIARAAMFESSSCDIPMPIGIWISGCLALICGAAVTRSSHVTGPLGIPISVQMLFR